MAHAAHALYVLDALLFASLGPWWTANALGDVWKDLASGALDLTNDTDKAGAAATRLMGAGPVQTFERREHLEELVASLEAAVRAHQSALETIATAGSSTGLALAGARPVVPATSETAKVETRKSGDSGIARDTVHLHGDQGRQEADKVGDLETELAAQLKVQRSSPKAQAVPEQFDDAFESVVLSLLGGFIGIFIFVIATVPSCRLAFGKYLKSLWRGEVRKEQDSGNPADKEEELKSRMDPRSLNFIAPGNIYRVTAVMHPGIIGFRPWCVNLFTALTCAFIQVYVTVRIISDFFNDWECLGLKSPAWYSRHAADFIAMLLFTATLNLMFSGKAAENIIDDAEANFYILTHQAPPASEQDPFVLPDIAGAEEGRAFSSSSHLGTTRRVPASEGYIPEFLKNEENLRVQEYFWCLTSQIINASTSLLCQVVFALRMMTFSGNLEAVVSVAIVLYFIFQLDGTLMDLDPSLRPKYRLEVLRRTVEQKDHPVWLRRMGAFSRATSTITGWCCLVAYVLLRWRSHSTGEVLGGSVH
eukprot:CAMPEP_0172872394 /NCGR_PEP_ID=MMETSP1075-20121228/92608_1 /TAXON_ID=2916 /ORGANISM="Ceratium fusus, Strain PA161109" /LENGTH=533 /DNA_ID=CAMNT_0013722717 /DNA_START=96 /DNA_END=1697 /DNA_ORIENTATION=+